MPVKLAAANGAAILTSVDVATVGALVSNDAVDRSAFIVTFVVVWTTGVITVNEAVARFAEIEAF
jgi:hypothetical protein